MKRTLAPIVGLSLLALAFSPNAEAARCDRADFIDAVPPDGATNVPINAPLYALYETRAEYIDEEVWLTRNGEDPVSVPPTYSSAEGLLSIAVDGGLEPGAEYHVEWPGLRGLGTASAGDGGEVTFTAGTEEDVDPPEFEGLTSVDWDLDRERDECTDAQELRFRFQLGFGEASDDGGADSLVLLIFQTRGTASGEPEPIRTTRFQGPGELSVLRTRADAIGEICFSALVRDLTGKVSTSGSDEVCVKTVEPPFFDGCSMSRPGSSPTAPGPWTLVAAGLAAAWARRRARS